MWSDPNPIHEAECEASRDDRRTMTEWDRDMATLRCAATGSVLCGEADDDRYGGEPW